VLRYAFGAVAVVIGGTLLVGAARIAIEHPVDAVAAAVTTATGLSGRGDRRARRRDHGDPVALSPSSRAR
jgi:hypothetical protein